MIENREKIHTMTVVGVSRDSWKLLYFDGINDIYGGKFCLGGLEGLLRGKYAYIILYLHWNVFEMYLNLEKVKYRTPVKSFLKLPNF